MRPNSRERAAALGALATAILLGGVVWLAPLRRGQPAAPSLGHPSRASGEQPVDPRDPLALLVGAEPSPDGRWLVLALDFERVSGSQSLYLVSLANAQARHVAEGVLTPQPWEADGRLAFVDRAPAAPRAVWLDPESFEVVRTASARELSRAGDRALLGPQWARRTQTRRPLGGYRERIEWRGRDEVLELDTQSLFDLELSATPGEVFELRRDVGGRALVRHSLGARRSPTVLLESKELAQFRLAPDGAKVLTSARDGGQVSYAVRSSADGSVLAGPWSGERVSASWLQRADSRFVLVTVGALHELVDLEAGSSTQLGEHANATLDVRVLPDGRVLLRSERRVDVLESSGALQWTLFPPQ